MPRANLAATNLPAFVLSQEKATDAIKNADPIQNLATVDNVTVNRGPRIDWIEQAAGPLQRARIEDISARRDFGRGAASPSAPGTAVELRTPAAGAGGSSWQPARDFRQAAESTAAQTRTVMQQKAATPEVITRIRLSDVPARTAPKSGDWKPARSDSAR